MFYKAVMLPEDKWKDIRKKLSNGAITKNDIIGTSLSEMCFFEDEEDNENLFYKLEGLLSLSESNIDFFFCHETDYGVLFFDKKEDLMNYICKDYADITWKELSDDELELWYNRLIVDGYYKDDSFIMEVIIKGDNNDY